jgi:hypothetical protein
MCFVMGNGLASRGSPAGHSAVPLDETGQTAETGKNQIERIENCDLPRAVQTAAIMNQQVGGNEKMRRELLRERFFGCREGESWKIALYKTIPPLSASSIVFGNGACLMLHYRESGREWGGYLAWNRSKSTKGGFAMLKKKRKTKKGLPPELKHFSRKWKNRVNLVEEEDFGPSNGMGTAPNTGPGTGPNTGPGTGPNTGPGTALR